MENKKQNADKTRIALMILITAAVVLTLLVAITITVYKKDAGQLILPGTVGILVLLFMIPIIKRRYINVKEGYPMEDERSKKIMNTALAKAYLLSIWWLLALGWASDSLIEFRDPSQAISAGILGMAVLFGLCYLYHNRKGNVE